MKKLLNYISVLGIALAFTACENDLEKVTYNVESTKAAVLATPATTSYVGQHQTLDMMPLSLQPLILT